ncbi:MAG: hypothetical protein Q4G03_11595 [Planctomycetia bacterium]|nr:hypothetical protein [Planctomycetia bacterium]
MAIQVICPGCMTSFEVDDRFAGMKGPCPKCGHIIEIPKERVIIHAPDTIISDGKTQKVPGHDARPIKQKLFVFTLPQLFAGLGIALGALLLAFLTSLAHSYALSSIVGALGVFAIAFPIAELGYMLIRDPNDLEMFLGGERHRRSLFAALVFGASWILFEIFVAFLGGSGWTACLYLIPIAAVGAFGALIFFDCNFGNALLVYLIFAFAAIIGRGLIYQPNGWIWQSHYRPVATAKEKPQRIKEETKTNDTTGAVSTPASAPTQEKADKPKLSREAPKLDPAKGRRR